MTVDIDLNEIVLDQLRADATRRGVSEADLVRSLVEQHYGTASNAEQIRRRLTPEEFRARLEELARIHEEEAPSNRQPLSDYAISRAGIYEDDQEHY